jgi:cysteine synthase A
MTIHGDNCVVLDVGPRIGGYRSEMMALAYGCPLDPMNLELSMGVTPQWSPRWQKAVAVLELFPPRNGILNGISGLDEAKRLPSFHRLVIRASPGEEVGLAKDGFRCPLFIILVHETEEVLQENLEFIRSRVKIELAPKSPP